MDYMLGKEISKGHATSRNQVESDRETCISEQVFIPRQTEWTLLKLMVTYNKMMPLFLFSGRKRGGEDITITQGVWLR